MSQPPSNYISSMAVEQGDLADVGQGRTGGRQQQRQQHRRIAEAYDEGSAGGVQVRNAYERR